MTNTKQLSMKQLMKDKRVMALILKIADRLLSRGISPETTAKIIREIAEGKKDMRHMETIKRCRDAMLLALPHLTFDREVIISMLDAIRDCDHHLEPASPAGADRGSENKPGGMYVVKRKDHHEQNFTQANQMWPHTTRETAIQHAEDRQYHCRAAHVVLHDGKIVYTTEDTGELLR